MLFEEPAGESRISILWSTFFQDKQWIKLHNNDNLKDIFFHIPLRLKHQLLVCKSQHNGAFFLPKQNVKYCLICLWYMYFYNGAYSIVRSCNGHRYMNMYIYFVKFKNFYYHLRYFYFRCKGCRLRLFKMVSK